MNLVIVIFDLNINNICNLKKVKFKSVKAKVKVNVKVNNTYFSMRFKSKKASVRNDYILK